MLCSSTETATVYFTNTLPESLRRPPVPCPSYERRGLSVTVYIHGLESNQQRNPGAAGRTIMSYQQQIPLMTKGHGDMLDITEQIVRL